MDWLLKPEFWTTFITLACLELVLGIDNVIFHSLTIAKLPPELQRQARIVGMSLAVLSRFLLLWSLVWFESLTAALFVVDGKGISARELVLIGGGAFLIIKSVLEVRKAPDGQLDILESKSKSRQNIIGCIIQIVVLDIVFSLDSVISAVAIATDMRAIMLAICIAVVVMMFFSVAVSSFINRHERIRTLAFLFIASIGTMLVAEACGLAIPKSYVYGLAGIALSVELVRIVLLRQPHKKRSLTTKLQAHRFDFAAAAEPMNVMHESHTRTHFDDQTVHCANCNTHKNGYWFCSLCGHGLGELPFALGEIAYSNYAN